MTADTVTLPIIDISAYLDAVNVPFTWPPTEAQRACSSAIHGACLSHGFFFLSHLDPLIPSQDFTDILETAKMFFDLPQHAKDRLSIKNGHTNGSDGARGYQRVLENVTQNKKDFHEGLDFYKPVHPPSSSSSSPSSSSLSSAAAKEVTNGPLSLPPSLPLHGRNQWPNEDELPDFRARVQSWIDRCLVVGRALVVATAVGLGMDEQEVQEMVGMIDDSFWVMRCIGEWGLLHVGLCAGRSDAVKEKREGRTDARSSSNTLSHTARCITLLPLDYFAHDLLLPRVSPTS